MATTQAEKMKASLQKPRDMGDLSKTRLGDLLGVHNKASRVDEIPVALLDPHPSQSIYSMNEEELEWLTANITDIGVLDPILVRPASEGRYTILAGHRRTEASRRAGKTIVPGIVMDVDDETALAIFHATNLGSRETLRPSEKAFGYLQLEEALTSTTRTSSPSAPRPSTSLVAESTGENVKQIFRYKRLTHLTPPLLAMVDADKMPLYAGVALSYLTAETQDAVLECVPNGVSVKQAEALRAAAGASGKLKKEEIETVLGKKQEKHPAKKAPVFSKRVASFFPKKTPAEEMEATIVAALEAYRKAEITAALAQKVAALAAPAEQESDTAPAPVGGTLKDGFATLFKGNTTPGV